MAREREIIEQKVFKLPGGEEFAHEVIRLDATQLEARISAMQKALDESEEHREDNMVLKDLKDQVATISGPYNDVRKSVKIKTQYIIALLKEKGKG